MLYQQVHSDPDVFSIRVPAYRIAPVVTNCYVVKDGGETLVVDSGAPTDEGYALLSSALRELGVEPVQAVFFLTHFHIDHAGLVDRIAPAGARVCASAIDLEVAQAPSGDSFDSSVTSSLIDEGVSTAEAELYAGSVRGLVAFDLERPGIKPVRDGDVLHVGRYCFQVVGTPGHTPGHVSLFEASSGILFGGDHILFGISPCIAVFPDGADGVRAYLDSLEKVRALGCRKLLHAHGSLRDGVSERVDWLIRHHRQRLDEAVGLIADAPGMTGEEIIGKIGWSIPFPTWEEVPAGQRWCILCEGAALLNHLVIDGRVSRGRDERGVFRYTIG